MEDPGRQLKRCTGSSREGTGVLRVLFLVWMAEETLLLGLQPKGKVSWLLLNFSDSLVFIGKWNDKDLVNNYISQLKQNWYWLDQKPHQAKAWTTRL